MKRLKYIKVQRIGDLLLTRSHFSLSFRYFHLSKLKWKPRWTEEVSKLPNLRRTLKFFNHSQFGNLEVLWWIKLKFDKVNIVIAVWKWFHVLYFTSFIWIQEWLYLTAVQNFILTKDDPKSVLNNTATEWLRASKSCFTYTHCCSPQVIYQN